MESDEPKLSDEDCLLKFIALSKISRILSPKVLIGLTRIMIMK